jgi:hypothetical protein
MFCNQSEEEELLHPDQNQAAKKKHPSINREIFNSGSRCFRAAQMLSEEHIIYPRKYACSPLENPCLLKPTNQNPEKELKYHNLSSPILWSCFLAPRNPSPPPPHLLSPRFRT